MAVDKGQGAGRWRARAVQDLRRALFLIKTRGPSQVQFWFIALAIGIAAGTVALLFRLAISLIQSTVYGTDDVRLLHSFAAGLDWYQVLLIPICGGLVVGLIFHRFTEDGRVRSVADVIEGAALNEGRVEVRRGLASGAASLVTLGTGGSTGREGPVVHLAAVISTVICKFIRADGVTGRDLLGCAVAAAVSASFNAPIAGALFALEVVLRHFAVHAFAPIAIASVAGTVVNRAILGDFSEFAMPEQPMLAFYQELPAFMLLGLLCGAVAVVLMRAIFWADRVADAATAATRLPRVLRPAVTGALLGLLAIGFPHIIGVGYETTARALDGSIPVVTAVAFIAVKVAAVAITMAGRMGGGVFSPALMIGALTGVAFGLTATAIFPEVSGSHTLYALAGMGGVAAAVLGAPISTTLIVFELTGDWQIGIAVMTSVSLSTALASRLVDRSFFLTQLERRHIHLAAGPQAYLLAMFRAGAVMRPLGDARAPDRAALEALAGEGLKVEASSTLEAAMAVFEREDVPCLAVMIRDAEGAEDLVGALFHVDALRAYNRALAATAAEEHS